VGQGRQAGAGLFPFCWPYLLQRSSGGFKLYGVSRESQAMVQMKEVTTECIKQNHPSYHHYHRRRCLERCTLELLSPVLCTSFAYRWSCSRHLHFGRPLSLFPWGCYRSASFGLRLFSVLFTFWGHFCLQFLIPATILCWVSCFPSVNNCLIIRCCETQWS
jgi:hypothetical protein